jgi:hypothetical protein
MTKSGWVSVVAYDPSKDPRVIEAQKNGTKVKPHVTSNTSHLLVRARTKDDLASLKTVVPSLVINEDLAADYRYRAVITRGAFKTWLSKQVDGIDYDSHVKETFRDAFTKFSAAAGSARYTAAMSIWSAWNKLQPYKPWGGYTGKIKGKFGKEYDATAWTEADLDDYWADRYSVGAGSVIGAPKAVSPVKVTSIGLGHEWANLRTPGDFDAELDKAVLSYEEAAKALGLAPPQDHVLNLDDLRLMLRDSEDKGLWYLDLEAPDIESLDEDAFELATELLTVYGHGGEITEEIFDELREEMFPSQKSESDIHSLPLSVDPT